MASPEWVMWARSKTFNLSVSFYLIIETMKKRKARFYVLKTDRDVLSQGQY
jgi:hypothetical protein